MLAGMHLDLTSGIGASENVELHRFGYDFNQVYFSTSAISMTDPDPISGNIYSFISVANELPLSAWGASGSAFPTTRSDAQGVGSLKVTQWTVQRSGRDRWILRNMWYPEPEYLSGVSGTLSITPTAFEWDIRPDRLGGHRIVFPETTQILSSVGEVGNGYIGVTLQSQDFNKDSQRWIITTL